MLGVARNGRRSGVGALLSAMLVMALMAAGPAWAAPDYDGDGHVADD
jgi:hypothetical protein